MRIASVSFLFHKSGRNVKVPAEKHLNDFPDELMKKFNAEYVRGDFIKFVYKRDNILSTSLRIILDESFLGECEETSNTDIYDKFCRYSRMT